MNGALNQFTVPPLTTLMHVSKASASLKDIIRIGVVIQALSSVWSAGHTSPRSAVLRHTVYNENALCVQLTPLNDANSLHTKELVEYMSAKVSEQLPCLRRCLVRAAHRNLNVGAGHACVLQGNQLCLHLYRRPRLQN